MKPERTMLAVLLAAAFSLAVVSAAETTPLPPTSASAWPQGTVDTWHGCQRHNFTVDGCRAWVVEPRRPLPGNPWSWCLEFPDAFTERCAAPALLAQGFHHVHIAVGNTFGSPAALKHFDAFYDVLLARGLARKTVLIGLSRGGLYAYRWAAEHPEKVAVIYGDAPVCDFKSWPGGKGKGKGSPGDWAALFACYGFKNEAEALAYPGNPVDVLGTLAEARIALLHVVGDADDVVPVDENTALVEERYRKLGGEMRVIHKAGVGHHPHGLEDPAPVVRFILEKTKTLSTGRQQP
jgi:pimeloyl-ACP methyl ester carboxylesterase